MTAAHWQAIRHEMARQKWPCVTDPAALDGVRWQIENTLAGAVRAGKGPPRPEHTTPEARELVKALRLALGKVRTCPAAMAILDAGTMAAYPWPPAASDCATAQDLYLATGPKTLLFRPEPGAVLPAIVQAPEYTERMANACAAALKRCRVTHARRPRQDLKDLVFGLAGIYQSATGKRATYTPRGAFYKFAAVTMAALPDHPPKGDLGRHVRDGVNRWRLVTEHGRLEPAAAV
jgi:hypothetical protein